MLQHVFEVGNLSPLVSVGVIFVFLAIVHFSLAEAVVAFILGAEFGGWHMDCRGLQWLLDRGVRRMVEKLLVDVIPQVVENLLGILLVLVKSFFNVIFTIVDLVETLLSLFRDLVLLVHDINFVLLLPLFDLVKFLLEPLEVLFDVSVDRLEIGFHILNLFLELREIIFELTLKLFFLIFHLFDIIQD